MKLSYISKNFQKMFILFGKTYWIQATYIGRADSMGSWLGYPSILLWLGFFLKISTLEDSSALESLSSIIWSIFSNSSNGIGKSRCVFLVEIKNKLYSRLLRAWILDWDYALICRYFRFFHNSILQKILFKFVSFYQNLFYHIISHVINKVFSSYIIKKIYQQILR